MPYPSSYNIKYYCSNKISDFKFYSLSKTVPVHQNCSKILLLTFTHLCSFSSFLSFFLFLLFLFFFSWTRNICWWPCIRIIIIITVIRVIKSWEKCFFIVMIMVTSMMMTSVMVFSVKGMSSVMNVFEKWIPKRTSKWISKRIESCQINCNLVKLTQWKIKMWKKLVW